MQVNYSIDAKFGGSGIGYIAYNAGVGIYQAKLLRRLFASSNTQQVIPKQLIRHWGSIGRAMKYLGAKDSNGLFNHLETMLYDVWVAAQLSDGGIFHGWNGMCLASLRKAKQLGMITVVERASSHPATQFQLLREEYQQWNLPLHLPTWNYNRSLHELEEADYITIPSPFVRQSMITAGIPEQKLIEIPFGMDQSRFITPKATSSHPFRVIFAGQISIRKGVPYLLEAWRQLQWSDAELWLVGGLTADFKTIQQRWANLTGVKFWGHSSDLPNMFQQSDLFVFPSIEEGSALVTYEAMACGLPVITTLNAGSVVRDGQDGFIIPIRDIEALRHRMQQLRDDISLRTQLGLSAREWVSQFSWASYQSHLIETYQKILRTIQ